MALAHRIAPCLWFDGQAEAAAELYVSVFPRSTIKHVARYGSVGREVHGHAPGTVMTVDFELDGSPFTALNGGPEFKFTEAISLQVFVETQAELDHYWNRLRSDPSAEQCGWLKDKFGVSWQIVPTILDELLRDSNQARADRAMAAMLSMKKLDIEALKRAHAG